MSLKFLFSFVLIFLFIFSPRLIIPIPIHTGAVAILVGFVFFKENLSFALLDKKIQGIGIVLLLLALYHFIFSFYYNHNPNYILSILISLFLSLVFSYVYSFFHLRTEKIKIMDYFELITLIVYVIFVNSLIVLLEFYFPQFKNTIESVLLNDPNANISFDEHAFRLRGFAASGGASLSVVNAVGIWFATSLAIKDKMKTNTAFFIIFVICFSNIFTGRTGLLFGLTFTSIFLFKKYLPSLIHSGLKPFLKSLIIFILLYIILPPIELTDEILEYAFEFFYSIESGSTSTASTDDLKSMLYIPGNPFHFIFGIGFFDGFNSIYERTDSGYLKTLLSFGFILGLLFYIFLFSLLFLPTSLNNDLLLFIVPVFLFLIFAEIKEPFLYQNYLSRIIMLLAGASLCELSIKDLNENGRSYY